MKNKILSTIGYMFIASGVFWQAMYFIWFENRHFFLIEQYHKPQVSEKKAQEMAVKKFLKRCLRKS